MFNLVIKRRVVIYPQFTAPPEVYVAGILERLPFVYFGMRTTTKFAAFELSIRLRRAEYSYDDMRRPDEEFLPMRRAPECPTSRYCLDCPEL